jgi:Outer membrane protein beta-barrel domain
MKKQIIFYFIFLGFLSAGYAQRRVSADMNLPDYDKQKIHYGFSMGLNFTRYQVKTIASPAFLIQPTISTGFSLGLLGTYQFNDFFAVRLAPSALFSQRILQYTDLNTKKQEEKVVEATYAELPILFKIKSDRRKNARMYMLVGAKYTFSLATKAQQEQNIVRAAGSDFAIEYGFGFERFYKMFKFAPEIRFSHGLNNVLIKDNNNYSGSLQSLYNHSVSIYLLFE